MPVDGTYHLTIHTPIGEQKAILTIQTEGNSLTGTSENATYGIAVLLNGKVNGNNLEWTENSKTPMGPLKLEIKATVNGDKIKGQSTSRFGPASFEGTRT